MCDSDCLNFKALGIYSHVVATAETNNKLIEFSVYSSKLPILQIWPSQICQLEEAEKWRSWVHGSIDNRKF